MNIWPFDDDKSPQFNPLDTNGVFHLIWYNEPVVVYIFI